MTQDQGGAREKAEPAGAEGVVGQSAGRVMSDPAIAGATRESSGAVRMMASGGAKRERSQQVKG